MNNEINSVYTFNIIFLGDIYPSKLIIEILYNIIFKEVIIYTFI